MEVLFPTLHSRDRRLTGGNPFSPLAGHGGPRDVRRHDAGDSRLDGRAKRREFHHVESRPIGRDHRKREMGVGLGFSLWEDRILLQPSIGFTHGRLLSGQPEGVAGDGIVPSLAAFYFGKRLELEAFFAYYQSMQKEEINYSNFILYWAYPGVMINDNISVGLHYESFDLTGAGVDTIFGPLYRWFGAYVKFTVNGKYSLRFSTGSNSVDQSVYAQDYYKVTATISFE